MKKQQIMAEGGRRIGVIKGKLIPQIKAGVTPMEIETLADNLILAGGDSASFKTVGNYRFATCININSGIVHGIPNNIPFKPGDLVTIDLGLIHQGFHVDTAFTVQIEPIDPIVEAFLSTGREALLAAIAKAQPGNSIYEVSKAMQDVIESAGYSVIRDLTGHGVGRELHLPPSIYCYAHSSSRKVIIQPNQALAIEIMYSMGDYRLKQAKDGWTLMTADGSLSAMFEESVYITPTGHQVLTTTILPVRG